MNLVDLARTYVGLMDREPKQQKVSVSYGTAVSDSANGEVSVIMDGYTVTPPSGVEETVTIGTSEFVNGQAELPHEVFAGTVTVVDSYGNTLDADEWQVDGNIISIEAMSGARAVEVDYPAEVITTVTSDEFHGDAIALQFEPTGTPSVVRGDDAVESTYSDGVLTVQGASIETDATFKVDYNLVNSVVAQFTNNVFQLPEATPAVRLYGYSGDTEDEIRGFTIDGSYITLTDMTGYDQYVAEYTVSREFEFNYSDTDGGSYELSEIPSEVLVYKNGDWYEDYTLEGGTMTVNWVPQEPSMYRISYSAHVHLDLLTTDFADGSYDLPTAPSGELSVYIGSASPDFELSGYTLTIPSLVGITHYTVTYEAKVSDGIVTLPCSPSVRAGEAVQVSVVGGTPIVTSVIGEGDRQDFDIDIAYDTAADAIDAAENAKEIAEAAEAVANATGQHFWDDGNGAHITEYTREQWNDASDTEHHEKGANSLWNSLGMLFRNGLTNLLSIVTSNTGGNVTGVSIYDGQGNASTNIVGSFTNSNVVLGKSNEKHLAITPSAIYMYDADGTIHSSIGTNFTIGRTSSYNTLLTSAAVYIRNAANYLLRAAGSTIYFYDGGGNNAANIAAQIGSAGATIGKTAAAHVNISSNSMKFLDGTQEVLSMVNETNYSGFEWVPTTLAGGDSGGRILAAKKEPFLWIQPYTTLSIGGTAPSSGYVRINGNGVTITPSVTLNNPLAASNIAGLPASKITSGTFDAARIPNLNTSKLTAGTLGIARGGTGSSQVVEILNNSTWKIFAWGPLVMVQVHGATAAATNSTMLANTLASYKPAANASTIVADASGSNHVARMYVEASTGSVKLASVGYTTSAAWYGTLVYMRKV